MKLQKKLIRIMDINKIDNINMFLEMRLIRKFD